MSSLILFINTHFRLLLYKWRIFYSQSPASFQVWGCWSHLYATFIFIQMIIETSHNSAVIKLLLEKHSAVLLRHSIKLEPPQHGSNPLQLQWSWTVTHSITTLPSSLKCIHAIQLYSIITGVVGPRLHDPTIKWFPFFKKFCSLSCTVGL